MSSWVPSSWSRPVREERENVLNRRRVPCLAALGRRVLCVDLDIGLRNLDIALGLDDRAVMDFTDVMELRCPPLTAATEHPRIHGFHLLTAPLVLPEPDIQSFRQLMAEAREYFDYIFMDSPAGLGDGFQLAMAAADRVIVVSAIDPAALRDAQRTVAAAAPGQRNPFGHEPGAAQTHSQTAHLH